MSTKYFAARGIKIVLFLVVAVAAFGAIVMLLWNALIPTIFGFTAINFWQALGLLILARILVGGFNGGRRMMVHGHHHRGIHGHHMHEDGRNLFREKWMRMSPEQQKQFIEHRRKFGFEGMFGCGEDFFGRPGNPDRENRESNEAPRNEGNE